MSLDERLDTLTPIQRAICEAIHARLPEIGDVLFEPVRVGFFLKHGRTFASLRLRRSGMRLYVMLPRLLDHPRLSSSRGDRGSSRVGHATTLKAATDVDDDVMRWLAEAYASSEA
jgi:hypothetical protein